MSKSTKSTDVNPSGFPRPIAETSCPGSWPAMTKSPGSVEKTCHPLLGTNMQRALDALKDEAKLTNPSPSNSKTGCQVYFKKGEAYITPAPDLWLPSRGGMHINQDTVLIRPNVPPSSQMDPWVHKSEKLTDLRERLNAQAKRLVKADTEIGRQLSELIKARDEVSARDKTINVLEKAAKVLSAELKEAKDDAKAKKASVMTAKAEARKYQSKTVDLQSKLAIAEKNEEFLKGRLMQSEKDGKTREARMEELILENQDMALELDIQKEDHQEACENAKLAFEDELLTYGEVIQDVIIEREEFQRKLKVAEDAIEPLKCDLATCRVDLNQAQWALESLKYGPTGEQAEVQCITGQTDLTEEGEPQTDDEEDHDEGLAETEEGEDSEWVMP
ncbi:hypothetical protein FVEN_g4816 [Fusarium venenatum]|uniref:Uncharacterized protein n=1 Tax=Fusarium venenatum TaxID=56646 RepID=A0A2L2T0R5_9HYPO|nr:uncharacterized protein FVRRES_11320 [Fusarium venenatum]KAG8357581.1 hypothetical protein FVEN_g4816 [Fusarium venenatum]KAH6978028.1 hypothetical protein EDB82DRAFT_503286 [Fusarium venenatum]CEI38629.1 unnamed protein product [Fusarium venenatum]